MSNPSVVPSLCLPSRAMHTEARFHSTHRRYAGPDVTIKYTVLSGADCLGKAKCLQATVGGTFSQWGQYMSLPAGAAYRLSIWARAVPLAGSPLPGAVVSLNLRQTLDPYTRYGQASWASPRSGCGTGLCVRRVNLRMCI